jgi:hypothetical protein
MKLDYVPLLQVQRTLQGIPRGMDRFWQYLRTILNADHTEVELLPLLIMNPMGKDNVTALLDTLLALDADGIAAREAAGTAAQLTEVPGDFKTALVVADDLLGGGTNRYSYEFDLRFRTSPQQKRFWVIGVLWSSETPTERAVREAVRTAAYRAAYLQQHDPARTLRDMLRQEGQVMSLAGCSGPTLDADDIAYTREILTPLLDANDMRTTIECLFGDEAGRTLGFTPRGLSPWAGLALALHDARPNPALQPTGPA